MQLFNALLDYFTVPVTPAPTGLAAIILTYNNQQAYWANGVSTFTEPAEGVVVHKINATQAGLIADQLTATVGTSAPMSIPLALLASESVLDPLCQNGNFLGSNPSKGPMGYDDGIAQLKLCDIEVEGTTFTPATAQAFAFDVTKAIPYFWSLYEGHLATADSWVTAGGPSNIDPRLMNRFVLACVMYKQGVTGAEAIFKSGTWPAELNNFMSLESYFATKLGEPSVFEGLV